jgi:transposase
MKREDIIKVYEAGPEAVVTLVQGLFDVIEKLQLRVEKLEEQINKNSHNSSKPPSSDGFNKQRGQRGHKKSRKKPGGQKGHDGHQLRMTDSPNHIQIENIEECKNCNASLENAKIVGYKRRQVVDLPKGNLEATEHQALIKECSCCGCINEADFPQDVTRPAQYGERIKGLVVYMSQYQLLPYERLVEFLKDIFGCTLSKGTVYNFNKQGFDRLKPVEEQTKELLKSTSVLHSDETGILCDKTLHWLHVASTSLLTYYHVDTKRGKEAMDTMAILPGYKGRVIHDFWKPYFRYDVEHGMCNAHLIRELIFIYEEYKQKWADEMIGLLLRIKKKTESCTGRAMKASTIAAFEKEYLQLLRKGFLKNPIQSGNKHIRGRKKQSKARNLLSRLETYKNEVLAFMFEITVPFDNNQAERDLRMVKVQQKISGCFRSKQGAEIYCRVRGYISTVRKNNSDVFDALQGLFAGEPFYPKFAE